MTGFVIGPPWGSYTVCGALGFLFAPALQISAALLSEDQRLKLSKFLDEEEKDTEATKQACPDIKSLPCAFVKLVPR